MAPRSSQSALRALDVLERCIDVGAQKAIDDPDGLAQAADSVWGVLSGENLSREVSEKIARVTIAVLACITDARKAERKETSQTLRALVPYAARAVALFLCVGFAVAFLFTPCPLGGCVPLAFALYVLGFGAPLKSLAKIRRR